jgi:5-methylthioadenosine/S-adenosylhomocysteine deaminase
MRILGARALREPREQADLGEHALIPGLVNAHAHGAMNLLRGYADDLPLLRWLRERIWPAEAEHLSEAFVHTGTLLAAREMLQGGVTCVNDMYFYPEAAALAYLETGLRAVVGLIVIDFPTRYGAGPDDYLARGLASRDRFRDEPTLRFSLAPHAPYTVSDAALVRIAALAEELDLGIHTHLHETRSEIAEHLAAHGCRPLARLQRLGLLSSRLAAVHAVHLEDTEIALLALHGASVVHCPASNLKLASGLAPAGLGC